MTRHMNVIHTLIHNLGAKLHKLVYDNVDCLFVSGNGIRRNNNKVVWSHRNLAVVAEKPYDAEPTWPRPETRW